MLLFASCCRFTSPFARCQLLKAREKQVNSSTFHVKRTLFWQISNLEMLCLSKFHKKGLHKYWTLACFLCFEVKFWQNRLQKLEHLWDKNFKNSRKLTWFLSRQNRLNFHPMNYSQIRLAFLCILLCENCFLRPLIQWCEENRSFLVAPRCLRFISVK